MNVEAEKGLVGALLVNSDLHRECLGLSAKDFSVTAYGIIFEAIGALQVHGGIDNITIGNYLEQRGELERAGGLSQLYALTEGVPCLPSAKFYVDIIREAALKRRIQSFSRSLFALTNKGLTPREVLTQAESGIFELGSTVTTGWYNLKGLVNQESLDQPARKAGRDRRATFGMASLDESIYMGPGELWIIGGRPSNGKSAFCANVVCHNVKQGNKVLWCVLEMGAKRNFWRMLSISAGVSLWGLKTMRLHPQEDMAISGAALNLYDRQNLRLSDCPGASAMQILGDIRRAKSEMSGLDLAVVDYAQLMKPPRFRKDTREELSLILQELQQIAGRESIALMLAAQLNRDADTDKKEDRPTMKELKGCGDFEEKSSGVILLHRWGKFTPGAEQGAELIVAKYQDGGYGVKPAFFDEVTQRWSAP